MTPKALRVAAFFLIGHFAILIGLQFLQKGPVDYVRDVVMLSFLVGSVAVLFNPRKRGWLMVVAYALYSVSPSIVGTWTIWAAPNTPLAAKIATSIVIVLFNSPLLVALVLVFKPASFAAFKTADAGDGAKQAPASGS